MREFFIGKNEAGQRFDKYLFKTGKLALNSCSLKFNFWC